MASDILRRSAPLLRAAVGGIALAFLLGGCGKEEKTAVKEIRPVRTVTVEPRQIGETLSLTGEIQPRYQADIGFRVDGKILARPVDVGTTVKKGDCWRGSTRSNTTRMLRLPNPISQRPRPR